MSWLLVKTPHSTLKRVEPNRESIMICTCVQSILTQITSLQLPYVYLETHYCSEVVTFLPIRRANSVTKLILKPQRTLPSVRRPHAASYKFTDVSEKTFAPLFKVKEYFPLLKMAHFPPKRWKNSTRLHGVTFQMTVFYCYLSENHNCTQINK
jgi:hypothetical protein